MKQFDKVYHTEHGKGHIVSVTHRKENNLYMCYFPKGQVTEFVTHKALVTDTDEVVSLERRNPRQERVSDDIQEALNNLFFGGQPPQE